MKVLEFTHGNVCHYLQFIHFHCYEILFHLMYILQLIYFFCANIYMGCFHFFPVAHRAPRNCMGYMGKNFFSVLLLHEIYIFILYLYL